MGIPHALKPRLLYTLNRGVVRQVSHSSHVDDIYRLTLLFSASVPLCTHDSKELSPRGCFLGLGHSQKEGEQLKNPKGKRKGKGKVKEKRYRVSKGK